jgi:hypothetical protein
VLLHLDKVGPVGPILYDEWRKVEARLELEGRNGSDLLNIVNLFDIQRIIVSNIYLITSSW